MLNPNLGISLHYWAQGPVHKKGNKDSLRQWVEQFKTLRADRVYIILSEPDPAGGGKLKLKYLDMEHAAEAIRGLHDAGIEGGCMEWSSAKDIYVEAQNARMAYMQLNVPECIAYQEDAEGTWTAASSAQVARACAKKKQFILELAEQSDRPLMELSVTYIPFQGGVHRDVHTLINTLQEVVVLAEDNCSCEKLVVVPQAYSFWKPVHEHWSHADSTAPVVFQNHAINQYTREVETPHTTLHIGLANYYQSGLPNHKNWTGDLFTGYSDCALTALTSTSVLCYWSSRWGLANNQEGEAFRSFIDWLAETDDLTPPITGSELIRRTQWLCVSLLDSDLGNYGPNNDGVDGQHGPKTEAAILGAEIHYLQPRDGTADPKLLSIMEEIYERVIKRVPAYDEPAKFIGEMGQ